MLEIEVVETGSTGIFGLIRKKARIRAQIKETAPAAEEPDVAPVVETTEETREEPTEDTGPEQAETAIPAAAGHSFKNPLLEYRFLPFSFDIFMYIYPLFQGIMELAFFSYIVPINYLFQHHP